MLGVDPPGQLLTAKEVARILNLSVRTVRRMTKDGTLPVIHIGRSVRVSPEALAALIAKSDT